MVNPENRERELRWVRIDESNYASEYQESVDAVKDFLYMAFEIVSDCLPTGDWDRAELGKVDPFRYLDIAYEYEYLFRSPEDLAFLHRSAALNLLCRLAKIDDDDECSGSTWMVDFRTPHLRLENEALIRRYHPELFQIEEAFEGGRIVQVPIIQRAFRAALYGSEELYPVLRLVTEKIVLRTFDLLAEGIM